MSSFVNLITGILSINLSLGSMNFTLGGVALGYILLRAGFHFFGGLTGMSRSDEFAGRYFGMSEAENQDYNRFMNE